MTLDTRADAQLHDLYKYPRTRHLESSRLQVGDTDHDQLLYRHLHGRFIVVEEKLDGANAAISFTGGGELLLQSRGHYLVGGSRERQFSQFKTWCTAHTAWLMDRLEDRFILFGEVMSKVHAVYYDRLPHLFFEFDVFDKTRQQFLSTEARAELLQDGPVMSVPVLFSGVAPANLKDLLAEVKRTAAKSPTWRDSLRTAVEREGHDYARAWQRLDKSDFMEGLYVKVEEGDQTVDRAKWVRRDFVQAIQDAGEHHLRQPYIPNGLAPGVDLYAPTPTVSWQALMDEARKQSWT